MTKQFNTVATLIRSARKSEGLSQSKLSERIGYKNSQFVSNVERGLCSIPRKNILIFADFLSMDPERIRDAMLADERIDINRHIEAQRSV